MSKYYKVEDVEMLVVFSGICDNKTCGEIAKALQSLPTIEVSKDAISREWILKEMHKYAESDTTSTEKAIGADHCQEIAKSAPSVIPKVKEGEWLLDGRCSECLVNPLTTHKNYCPNCGAKMKGGR